MTDIPWRLVLSDITYLLGGCLFWLIFPTLVDLYCIAFWDYILVCINISVLYNFYLSLHFLLFYFYFSFNDSFYFISDAFRIPFSPLCRILHVPKKRPICVIYFTILIENERYRLNIYSKYELRITRKFNCVAQHTITSVAQHTITKGQSLQF